MFYFKMSDQTNDAKKEEQRPLGAVLGWLNLSPTLPNAQDNMAGATAGRLSRERNRFFSSSNLCCIQLRRRGLLIMIN
jgi:hypothetical protein